MTKFTCLNNENIQFRGTVVSPVNSFLYFKIEPCNELELRKTAGYENENCAPAEGVKNFFERHVLVGAVANTFVNKTQFDSSPIRTISDIIFYE